jgi:hypothetical protein
MSCQVATARSFEIPGLSFASDGCEIGEIHVLSAAARCWHALVITFERCRVIDHPLAVGGKANSSCFLANTFLSLDVAKRNTPM